MPARASLRSTARSYGDSEVAKVSPYIIVRFLNHLQMDDLVALLRSDTNAANAFAAISSAVVALLAFVVSVVSVVVALRALRHQQTHNILSVSPIPEVTVADYENSLRVKLRNNGTGPLIVDTVAVRNGSEERESLIAWMPTLPGGRPWSNFCGVLTNRSLQPGSEVVLVELTRSPGEEGFAACRELVRQALAPLSVRVSYTDVYKSRFPSYSKDLSWFGRRTQSSSSQPSLKAT